MREVLAQAVGSLLGVIGAAVVILLMAIVVTTVVGADMRSGGEDSNASIGSRVTSGATCTEEKSGL